MNNSKLERCLKRLGSEELKGILGRDLVEQLLEWDTRPMTKALLAEMIVCVRGVSILKDKQVRKRVLEQFSEKEILSFVDLLPSKYSNCKDLASIVDYVSGRSWRLSDINSHLVSLLGYSNDDVFAKKPEATSPVEAIDINEKFYELLDYQYVIRQQALNVLESPATLSRFLIHMPTGTGKTKTATHIACHYFNFDLKKKGLILWVAHTKELLQQAYETFSQVWRVIGDGVAFEYRLWEEYEPAIPDDGLNGIMVCGIQKLQAIRSSNPSLYEQIRRDVRLVIFDEAHKAAASETKDTINDLMTCTGDMHDRSLMGLTATPGRTTEHTVDNVLLSSMFGNRSIGIDLKLLNSVNLSPQEALNAHVEESIIKYFQTRGVLSRIVREELEYPEKLSEKDLKEIKVVATDNGYDDFSRASLELIGKNKSRNLTIKNKLLELNEQSVPTIVFACSVAHAQLLSAMLTLDGVENAVIIGDMSSQERAEAIRRFRDVEDSLNMLINYEVLTTGFDATNIECVLIARPTKSVVLYSQMLGRGLRGPQMGGNETCKLIDVKDNLGFDGESIFEYFSMYWEF